MIFYVGATPDGWGIPGAHGVEAIDNLDGSTQGGVFLVRGGGANLLVDSGTRTDEATGRGMGETLIRLLDAEPDPLAYIFLTHFHYDHCGNAALLKERYGAQVLCHPCERRVIENPLAVFDREWIESFGTTPEALRRDFNLAPDERLSVGDADTVRRYWNWPVEIDRVVVDGDVVEVGDLELEVLHLPGHCPGHCGLWNPASRTLYSGDLLNYPSPFLPWPLGDAGLHEASIRRCLALAPEVLLEGHGLSASNARSAGHRLAFLLDQQEATRTRIELVLRRAARPQTVHELVPEVLPVRVEGDYAIHTGRRAIRSNAAVAMQTHLCRLIELGRVRRIDENGRVAFLST